MDKKFFELKDGKFYRNGIELSEHEANEIIWSHYEDAMMYASLRNAGVDNWEGYAFAKAEFKDSYPEFAR